MRYWTHYLLKNWLSGRINKYFFNLKADFYNKTSKTKELLSNRNLFLTFLVGWKSIGQLDKSLCLQTANSVLHSIDPHMREVQTHSTSYLTLLLLSLLRCPPQLPSLKVVWLKFYILNGEWCPSIEIKTNIKQFSWVVEDIDGVFVGLLVCFIHCCRKLHYLCTAA